jgi:hypothetical protein
MACICRRRFIKFGLRKPPRNVPVRQYQSVCTVFDDFINVIIDRPKGILQ